MESGTRRYEMVAHVASRYLAMWRGPQNRRAMPLAPMHAEA